MKHKTLLLQALIVSLLLPLSATAQKPTINWYGFVAAQSFTDTHKSASAADGFLYLYPIDRKLDVNDNDQNSIVSGSEFGTMARIGFVLTGPEIFGAASRAKAEIECSGHDQASNHVLYRHAFMALDWNDGSSLLLGQTWHPMNDLFPSTVSIAIGSPFNALNRSPQLRGSGFLDAGKKLNLTIACIFQALNTSVGPDPEDPTENTTIKSNKFQRNSTQPNIYLGLDWNLGDLKLGAGAEYQRIVPFVDTDDNNEKYYLNSFSGMLQAQYAKDKLSVKGKVLLGQNMSHLGICSGYGLTTDADRKYSNLTALSSWAQVQYGTDLKWGLFGGYMKNLGAADDLAKIYAVGGGKIDSMWRVAPNVQYTVGNLNLGLEFELTSVAYGTIESKGTVTDTHDVFNFRTLLSAMYSF